MVPINPSTSRRNIVHNPIENLSQPQRTLFALQFQADNHKYPALGAEVEIVYREGVKLAENIYLFYEKNKSYNDAVPTAYFNHEHITSIPDLGAVLKAQEKGGEFIYRDDQVRFLIIKLMIYDYDAKEYTPKKKLLPFDLTVFVIPGIRIVNEYEIRKIYFVSTYVADRRAGDFSHPHHQVFCNATNTFPTLNDLNKSLNLGKAWIQAELKQNLYKSRQIQ